MQKIIKSPIEYREELWQNVGIESLSLVKAMLSKKSKHRPTIQEVRNHPWLSQAGQGTTDMKVPVKLTLNSGEELERLRFGRASSPVRQKQRKNSKGLTVELPDLDENRSCHSDDGSFYLDQESINQNPEFDNKKPRAISLRDTKLADFKSSKQPPSEFDKI